MLLHFSASDSAASFKVLSDENGAIQGSINSEFSEAWKSGDKSDSSIIKRVASETYVISTASHARESGPNSEVSITIVSGGSETGSS